MAYLLNVFTPETWQAFRETGAHVTGFPVRRQALADERVHKGDIFLCYLTRLSRWCGVLLVESAPDYAESPMHDGLPFPIRVRVKPVVVLEPKWAVPIRADEVWNTLTITKQHEPGYNYFGGYIQDLNTFGDDDGSYLEKLLKRQQSNPKYYCFSEKDKSVAERVEVSPAVVRFLEQSSWRFAKKMPNDPHWYIVRDKSPNDDIFTQACTLIQSNGTNRLYCGSTYITFALNGYNYWTMGWLPEKTIIINRIRKYYISAWDEHAGHYAPEFDQEEYRQQVGQLADIIRLPLATPILDLGCGNGMLLRLLKQKLEPSEYLGIDQSEIMLRHFCARNPEYVNRVVCSIAEDYVPTEHFGTIVALYGSALSLPLRKWESLARRCDRMIVMWPVPEAKIRVHKKFGITEPWQERPPQFKTIDTVGDYDVCEWVEP